MSSYPEDIDPRVRQLVAADCNGTITEEEMRELEAILEADLAVQEFYIDFVAMNAGIHWLVSARQRGMNISDTLSKIPNYPPPQTFLGNWVNFINHNAPLSFIMIFLIFGLMIFGPIYFSSTRHINTAENQPVAQITQTRTSQWSTAFPKPEEAEQLKVGRQLQLEKGLVQITYANKAIVLLEGPASYTVDTPKSGFLGSGKLIARADSEQSQQFTIATPTARFVDMGTEFGVAVEDTDRVTIAVFAGNIKAEAKKTDGGWTEQISLEKGQAGIYEQAKFTYQVCKRSDFPTLQPLPPPSAFQRWLEASNELLSRRDLVAYYDFQPDPNNANILKNRAPSGAEFNGQIQNAAWVRGRFEEKNALEFQAEDAGVRVNLEGKFEQITLVTWVNINKLENNLSGLLMSNDWSRPGQLHWEINIHRNIDLAEFMFNEINNTVIFQSQKAVPNDCINHWCMISGIIDRANKRCVMYVNDKCILSQSYETRISVIKNDNVNSRKLSGQSFNSQIPVIEIGQATIAGWLDRGKDPSPNKVRNLNCRMDELMIFGSALTEGEILQLYEAGKP